MVFLYSKTSTPTAATAVLPGLENPYVSSFGLSRPENPGGISFPLFRTVEFEMYLHPFQVKALAEKKEPPKARAAFDIYGFRLMLAEVGFWNKVGNITGISNKKVSSSSSSSGNGKNGGPWGSEEVRRLVIAKCESDLACWAGRRYRDAVLTFLRAEDVMDGGIGEDPSDFFDLVIAELAKCCKDWVF